MRIAVNNENTTPPRLLGAGIQKPRFSITMMLHHITTPLCYNCGFYTVRWSIAFLLLLTLLCIDGQTMTMGDGLKHEYVCLKTVTHFYSNPGVTGHSALQFEYKNDELQTEQLNLTCGDQDEEPFIEVKSVVLSLPSQGDDSHYCGESTESSYMNCKQASQCNCCRKPTDRCTHNAPLEEYQDCNRQKSCLLTVTSKYLNDCPTIDYPCDGKRCHSRWADVTYACRQKNAIPTEPAMHRGCRDGFYGRNCLFECSTNCLKLLCKKDSDNGECIDGCKLGYIGDNCTKECPAGKYGEKCLSDCFGNCKGPCDVINGVCRHGCVEGWTGQYCDFEKQVTQPYIIAIVTITSALAVLSIVVLLIIGLRKKQERRESSDNEYLPSPVERPVNYENIDAAEMSNLHQYRDGEENETNIYEANRPIIPEGESTYTILNAST